MDKKIFLVRHGQIDYGSEKRYIGITDLPLSNAGIRQATRLQEYFSRIEIEKAYTSPLKRCLQTAEILLEGSNTQKVILDDLKEINMGEWENQTIDYIKDHFRELYEKRGVSIDEFIPPGGESFEQLQKRVIPAFEFIAQNNTGNTLIISHAGVNRVILSKLFDFPLKELFKISQPYGCINELSWDIASRRWQWDQKNTKS
ncbi:MAG: histidine phosphatase family protein [Dehalobacter sp. 4CP]|uniref:histidine phosphatase family protein n=1 Tax=Dehalobacter sp. CP TaxID=2594474 RepID=UPI0013CBB9CE|nr:histidine phosphatase family protein [Dehalobacter sp.]NBJ15941.1 histidine phosphatase family protein [Dehalobacter sp. 4CP]